MRIAVGRPNTNDRPRARSVRRLRSMSGCRKAEQKGEGIRRHAWLRAVVAVGAFTALVGSPLLNAPPAGASIETTYFIALGDSLPLGEQADTDFNGQPDGTLRQGFVEHMAQELSDRYPNLAVRNLACSGETTWGMRHNTATEEELAEGRPLGCKPPNKYREDYPLPGHSQLTEAVAMLKAHGGAVKLVTVTAGANDVIPWCLTTGAGMCRRGQTDLLQQVREELTAILGELNAVRRPSTRIVGTIYYNPFQRAGEDSARAMVDALNATLAEVYAGAGVPVARADLMMPDSDSVCRLTTWCTWLNYHPNDDGYVAIGDEFLRVLRW